MRTVVCDLNGYKLFPDERPSIECMWGSEYLLPLKHTGTHGQGNMDISAITLHALISEKKWWMLWMPQACQCLRDTVFGQCH